MPITQGAEGKLMDEAGETRAALICGPTASGKSALALELARVRRRGDKRA